MRVPTRLALGSGVLVAVVGGALALHLVQMRRLVAAHDVMERVTFRAATTSLALARHIDRLDEYSRKLQVTADADYAAKTLEERAAVATGLAELAGLALSSDERVAVARLEAAWARLSFPPDGAAMVAETRGAAAAPRFAERLAAIEAVRGAVRATFEASRTALTRQVADSAAAGGAAVRATVLVLVSALAVATGVVWLTVRSIAVPLRGLAEGTRAVTAGALDTRLPVVGDDELARVAEDFNAMVSRLDELDRLKRDFVSHVSHELKTPLAAMQETARLMLEEVPGPLTPQQRRLLELTDQATRRLGAMIRNLLEISRIEAGAMEYVMRTAGLGALVAEAVAELEAWAGERGVTIAVEGDGGEVRCDRDRLVEVVQNLVDNAVRLSPPGARVTVVGGRTGSRPAASLSGGGPWATVAVLDRGPGVPQADREAVFDRFRQLGGGRRRPGAGVGLGLAICRQIVEAHGGAIWVEDNEGGGSVFRFALPVAGEAPGRGGVA